MAGSMPQEQQCCSEISEFMIKTLVHKGVSKGMWFCKEAVRTPWLPARLPAGPLPTFCPNFLSIP